MKFSEAQQAVKDLAAAEVDHGTVGCINPEYPYTPVNRDGDVVLVVDVKGPRGGRQRREYKSYSAFTRALPSMKHKNSTRTKARRTNRW